MTVFSRGMQIDTPFGFSRVAEARLVVEGCATAGWARGDGVQLESDSFELIPAVSANPSFQREFNYGAETLGAFRIDEVFPEPFFPTTTPLPNPDGYPPVSFQVFLSVFPSSATLFPARIGNSWDATTLAYVVETPIIAQIDTAYIILSGPNTVPEPSGLAAVVAGCLTVFASACGRAIRDESCVEGCPKSHGWAPLQRRRWPD
ncbi:hypothetical protein Pla175_34780 [Pirellulimonas nuda]|uniref:Uncharacterized protein n=1 Tax=Pirellulimonas nuda TaxID=2528009 RepID=A0A518DF46_9BACT|nr:hypothetical protein [Pirellulimonas nuda]QDU90078.1 hypothetical protein Pla175_34780 [Pirellulimonas nuda]